MTRVLLFSTTTGYQLRSFDEAAERLGIELVFATDRCSQLDDPWQDRAIPIRFHEEASSIAAVVAEARRSPFRGVLSVGDRPTVLAALVAEELGLPGNTPDAASASVNKEEARARFAAAGLNVPWHFILPIRGLGVSEFPDSRVIFPCVLKPVGLSGSRGVIRANSPSEFTGAFRRIRALLDRVDVRAARTGFEDLMLVEGFIPGREVAIEGVLNEGELQVFAIFDKPDPLDGPFFEETIYVTPSRLDTAAQRSLIETIQHGCDALGLWHGSIHAECRFGPDGIFVLEIASRPIGGLCSKALRLVPPAAASFARPRSLEEVLLRHAMGEHVSAWTREPAASAVMMIPIPKRGLLKEIRGEDEARAVPYVEDVVITAKPDQLLEPLPEAGSYLGFIFARGATPDVAEAAVRDAHSRLTFSVDPAIEVRTETQG
jgi:biotin carboxylase